MALSAIKDTCELICVCPRDYVHMEVNTWQVIHLLWGPLQYTAFQPLLWFLSFHAFALHWSFYTYYTRSFPTKTPDPLIPRWVNCSSCPWPQPFVAIAPDFLRGPDLIWPYQSHLHSSLLWPPKRPEPFQTQELSGCTDLSSSQTSSYTAQRQWALFSDSSWVR